MALQTWELVTIIVMGLLLIIIGVVIAVIILRKKMWPFQVTILEQDPKTNNLVVSYRDRAKHLKFGDGGERIFFFRNHKRYAPDYGKRIGKNAVAFAIGTDGYLYNVTFQGIDKKLLEIGVTPTETSARLSNSALRKGIESRYNDKSFFEKWGVAITIGMLVVAIIVQSLGTWINHKEENKGKAQEVQIAEAQKETITLAKEVLANVDSIRSGGSGLVPVT